MEPDPQELLQDTKSHSLLQLLLDFGLRVSCGHRVHLPILPIHPFLFLFFICRNIESHLSIGLGFVFERVHAGHEGPQPPVLLPLRH